MSSMREENLGAFSTTLGAIYGDTADTTLVSKATSTFDLASVHPAEKARGLRRLGHTFTPVEAGIKHRLGFDFFRWGAIDASTVVQSRLDIRTRSLKSGYFQINSRWPGLNITCLNYPIRSTDTAGTDSDIPFFLQPFFETTNFKHPRADFQTRLHEVFETVAERCVIALELLAVSLRLARRIRPNVPNRFPWKLVNATKPYQRFRIAFLAPDTLDLLPDRKPALPAKV